MSAGSAGPTPRRGQALVYSRGLGVVFVLGGTRIGEVTPSGEIWASDLAGYWQRLTFPSLKLGNVDAATYSFTDHSLYVVDRVESEDDDEPHRRFFRISLRGGGVHMLGSWRTELRHDRVWLSGDRGGEGVVLSCSAGTSNAHRIVQIQTRSGLPKVTLTRRGHGRIPVAPIVDSGGYTVVTLDTIPNLHPTRVFSLSELPDSGDGNDENEGVDEESLSSVRSCLR